MRKNSAASTTHNTACAFQNEASGPEPGYSAKPLVHIGWVLAVDESDQTVVQAYRQAAQLLHSYLAEQFPQFQWKLPFLQRRRYSPHGALEPLPLLELGLHEKIYGAWDYAVVVVSNDLTPRTRVFTLGVPSSALEVALLSSARLDVENDLSEQVAALALHLLGHMWGLEHHQTGPMSPPEDCSHLQVALFPKAQHAEIVNRLEEVADRRLEEKQRHWNWLSFHWHSFWADPQSIFIDTIGYKPWRLPFRMGRLTAAAAASILVMLLGAEAWEIGVSFSGAQLWIGALCSILIAALFVFFGQNLGEVSRQFGWREQLARTRIVLFCTLLGGMISLWGVLFLASYLAVWLQQLQI
jgi:hypothetical protein